VVAPSVVALEKESDGVGDPKELPSPSLDRSDGEMFGEGNKVSSEVEDVDELSAISSVKPCSLLIGKFQLPAC